MKRAGIAIRRSGGSRAACLCSFGALALLLFPGESQSRVADPDTATLTDKREPEEVVTDEYEPLAGMDANGRIPGVARPTYLAHPDRWRYVPEGRLKPGNPWDRFLVSSFVAPYAFRSSDIGLGFGVAITDLDFRNSRRQEFSALLLSYSSEGQQDYVLKWRRWLNHIELPDGGILQEERSRVEVEAGFTQTLTLRFFGLGGKSDDRDETSYTDRTFFGDIGVDWAVPAPGSNWVLHAGVRGENHELSEGELGGQPSMDETFPDEFTAAEHSSLGWTRLGLRYDTRDSQENPYEGWHLGGLTEFAPAQTDGDLGARFTLSGSQVFRMLPLFHDGGDPGEENPPTDIFAVGVWNQYAVGDLPFFALPSLGGPERHRGFIAGRFYGEASWLAAAEYRFWILPRGLAFTRAIRLERVGAALFYEAGNVSDSASRLFSEEVRHTYGVSLRLSFERTAPFRFDFGMSKGNTEFNVGYGLTF